MDKKIAVLIPCYNEEMTIGKVIDDFHRVCPDADVYVYNNNSTDATATIAAAKGAIVREEYRQGKGNVIRSMFRDIDADCYIMFHTQIGVGNRLDGGRRRVKKYLWSF